MKARCVDPEENNWGGKQLVPRRSDPLRKNLRELRRFCQLRFCSGAAPVPEPVPRRGRKPCASAINPDGSCVSGTPVQKPVCPFTIRPGTRSQIVALIRSGVPSFGGAECRSPDTAEPLPGRSLHSADRHRWILYGAPHWSPLRSDSLLTPRTGRKTWRDATREPGTADIS